MKVEWIVTARDHIDAITRNRANYSEDSAARLREAILSRGDQLADFPLSGRMIPEFQLERLREVPEQGFRIMYEVFADRVEVFAVLSARQDLSTG